MKEELRKSSKEKDKKERKSSDKVAKTEDVAVVGNTAKPKQCSLSFTDTKKKAGPAAYDKITPFSP